MVANLWVVLGCFVLAHALPNTDPELGLRKTSFSPRDPVYQPYPGYRSFPRKEKYPAVKISENWLDNFSIEKARMDISTVGQFNSDFYPNDFGSPTIDRLSQQGGDVDKLVIENQMNGHWIKDHIPKQAPSPLPMAASTFNFAGMITYDPWQKIWFNNYCDKDRDGNTHSVGIEISEMILDHVLWLPQVVKDGGALCDDNFRSCSPAYELRPAALPEVCRDTVIEEVVLRYSPSGSIFNSTAKLEFLASFIPMQQRMFLASGTCRTPQSFPMDCSQRQYYLQEPDWRYKPPYHVVANNCTSCEALVGNRWLNNHDPTSDAIHRLVYAMYAGQVHGLEYFFDVNSLSRTKSWCLPLKQYHPDRFAKEGYYPTTFCSSYNPSRKTFKFEFRDFNFDATSWVDGPSQSSNPASTFESNLDSFLKP